MEYSEQSDKQNKSVVANNKEVKDYACVMYSILIVYDCFSRMNNEITIN